MRVPATSRKSGVMSPAAVAIRPKVTMPLANAWPDEPRTANAVMCVPKSEVRKTYGPTARPARKYCSAPSCAPRCRNAKMPMYSTTAR